MFVLTMLLMAAPPVADRVRVKRPAVVRTVRLARKARRVRKPISMSVIRPVSGGCASDPICVTATSGARYRLPLPQTPEPSTKDMALAEDGTRCALIGQTICPRRTRTILHMGESAPGVPASAIIK